jgi:hypothetical protein
MSGKLTDHYQRGIRLVQENRLEEALRHFEAYLQERPSSGKVWNDAGTCCVPSGAHGRRGSLFSPARCSRTTGRCRRYRNVVCGYLQLAQPEQALQWLKTVDHQSHADVALAVRTAQAFERQGRRPRPWRFCISLNACRGISRFWNNRLLNSETKGPKSLSLSEATADLFEGHHRLYSAAVPRQGF